MYTWKTHLSTTLCRLARTHGSYPLSQIESLLAGIFEAETVAFRDPLGQPLPADTTLAGLIAAPFAVTVHVLCGPPRVRGSADGDARPTAAPDPASRFHAGQPPADDQSPDARFERFVRDFDRLEQHHEFMWAGYVVREFLPRCGFPADEAKVILDRLRAEGILAVSKVQNPRNPGFPATGVRLNRDHPRVTAILGPALARPAPDRESEPPVASDVPARGG